MAAQPVETADPTRSDRGRLRVAADHVRTPLLNPPTLLGALLVTLSGLGLFVAAADDGGDGTPVVVAAQDLRPGQRLEVDDLTVAQGSLPDSVETFTAIDELRGRVVLGPVGAGQVVPPGAISSDRQDDGADTREVALSLPRPQVAVGRLGVGDRVDVFVTDEERTSSVVRGAMVVHLAEGGDGLTAGREVRIVVAVEDDASVAALVHALRTGEVTVVRSTFAAERIEPVSHPPEAESDGDQEAGDGG